MITTGRVPKFLILLWLLPGACSDLGTPLDPEARLIVGSWVWQRSQGGFFGQFIFPPAGSTTVDTFFPYGNFTRVKDGILVLTARFTVENRDSQPLIQYSDVSSRNEYPVVHLFNQWIKVEGDTLLLADDGADLYRHIYSRVR